MRSHFRKQGVSRRVVLSTLGASMALPWLESSRLLGDESAQTPPKRFAFLFSETEFIRRNGGQKVAAPRLS